MDTVYSFYPALSIAEIALGWGILLGKDAFIVGILRAAALDFVAVGGIGIFGSN
jgi:hypothetical protein